MHHGFLFRYGDRYLKVGGVKVVPAFAENYLFEICFRVFQIIEEALSELFFGVDSIFNEILSSYRQNYPNIQIMYSKDGGEYYVYLPFELIREYSKKVEDDIRAKANDLIRRKDFEGFTELMRRYLVKNFDLDSKKVFLISHGSSWGIGIKLFSSEVIKVRLKEFISNVRCEKLLEIFFKSPDGMMIARELEAGSFQSGELQELANEIADFILNSDEFKKLLQEKKLLEYEHLQKVENLLRKIQSFV